jgi:hypothetical protein
MSTARLCPIATTGAELLKVMATVLGLLAVAVTTPQLVRSVVQTMTEAVPLVTLVLRVSTEPERLAPKTLGFEFFCIW